LRLLRNWLGDCPVVLRKAPLNELAQEYPKMMLTSVIEVARSVNCSFACCMRRGQKRPEKHGAGKHGPREVDLTAAPLPLQNHVDA
jgi:hypothetical protein